MRFPGLFTGMKNLLWVRGLVGFAGVGWLAGVAGAEVPQTGLTLRADGPLRTYELRSTAPLRGHTPPAPVLTFAETAAHPVVRSGNRQFDALYALALHEAGLNSVAQIQDFAYGNNTPLPLAAFQTGEVWTYVWTRDQAYSTHLGLAGFDPARSVTSLLFKSSDTKASVAGGFRRQIIQDTGSGGSYPVSTDRVVWALGAEAALQRLPDGEREPFLAQAYALLHDTLEQDRRLTFDETDGLYRGEQSFLDWREQTYPAWTKDQVLPIAQSKALSVNVLNYHALGRAADYARQLGHAAENARYTAWAAALKDAINRRFYDPAAGLYSTYLLTDGGPAVRVHRYDLLGEALAILTGVASPEQAQSIFSHYPVGPYGPSVVWPQDRSVPIYHNQAIWPFVTAYWLKAARQAGQTEAVERGVAWFQQEAAENLSNMENFDFVTGRVDVRGQPREGPVVNSRRQLWSVAAYLSMVQDTVFGLEASSAGLRFQPFLTAGLRRGTFGGSDTLELRNLDYRGAKVQVKLHLPAVSAQAGGVCRIERVLVNGRAVGVDFVPRSALAAENQWEVFLAAPAAGAKPPAPLRLVDVSDERAIFGPAQPEWDESESPALTEAKGRLTLHFKHADAAAVRFNLYRDGQPAATGWPGTSWTDPDSGDFRERVHYYAIEAVDARSGNASFLSPSRHYTGERPRITLPAIVLANHGGKLVGGHHFEDWGRPGDTLELKSFQVERSARYALRVEFSNGAGAVNTGITCGVKKLEILRAGDGQVVASGYLVMPQSGDWARWDLSSPVSARLNGGEAYTLRISEDEVSRNMSYLENNTRYTAWPGGGPEAYNFVRIAAVHLLGVE